MKELDTPVGREVKAVYDAGELVEDDLIIRMIRDRLDRGDTIPGFVLDGFPRNMAQAEALDELLEELGRDLDVVFELQVPREVLLERMQKRAVEENRSDDTPEAISAAARDLRARDRAARRVLPHDSWERRRHPRRSADRRDLRRDPGGARPGGGST